MFFIIYFTGIIPAYFIVRWDFINDAFNGNRDKYTRWHRIKVIAFSIFSWFMVACIGLKLGVTWLESLSGNFNKRAKW